MAQNPDLIRLVRVFVSSPGDVQAEREVLDEVIGSINRVEGQANRVRLEAVKWETSVVPQIGPPPQDVVDAQTAPYDIYLGIMSSRFGTPTDKYGSGTEQEFRDTVQRWGTHGKPWILFYFNDQPPFSKKPAEVQQYLKVCTFREELQKRGIVGGYSGVRGTKDGFYEQVHEHLRQLIQTHLRPSKPSKRAKESQAKPKPPTPTPAKPTVPQAYREWLQAQCADIDLLGLRLKQGQAVRLNNVYVPLTTHATDEADRDAQNDPGLQKPDEREKPQLLLNSLDKQSLYVSGPPGSGKSTFCRWVAWLACAGAMPNQQTESPVGFAESFPNTIKDRLPLLIRLREFWSYLPEKAGQRELALGELEESIGKWLRAKRNAGIEWADVFSHIGNGSALVILDGVDEVPLRRGEERSHCFPRDMLLSGLAVATSDWVKRGNRVLVTSRPYGLSPSDLRKLGLVEARIDDIPRPLQDMLVRRWFQILADNPSVAEATAQDMTRHVRERDWLQPLAANPMLLTAMCIIYSEGKRLPHDQHDLYTRIVDNVLYNRYPNDPALIDQARNRLAVIAYGMHTGLAVEEERATPQAETSYAEIDRIIQIYRDQSPETEAGFRDAVETREHLLSSTGLLLPKEDQRASFYHFTIQDFLAAQRLLDLEFEGDRLFDVFCARSANPRWRKTLSFVFGSLLSKFSATRAIKLLGRLTEAITPKTTGLQVVAADCLDILLGRKIRLQPELEERFRGICLAAIEQELAVHDRWELGRLLGQLGDPRIITDLRDRAAYVEVAAGPYLVGDERRPFQLESPFLITKFPVANCQYALFIEQGGYDQPQFWSEDGRRWLSEQKVHEPIYWQEGKWNGPNQPVVGISFWEAEACCAWAGGRLPTEWEWEAAARGPDGHEYPWGGPWEDGICNSREAGLGVTSSVGLFPRSRSKPFGVEDMAGNVWEWCPDLYDPRKYEDARVLRGGSWIYASGGVRSANRFRNLPDYRNYVVGFRVVLSVGVRTQ